MSDTVQAGGSLVDWCGQLVAGLAEFNLISLADDTLPNDGPEREALNERLRQMIRREKELVVEIGSTPASTKEEMRAKAFALIETAKSECQNDASICLALSLARDILHSDLIAPPSRRNNPRCRTTDGA